MDTGARRELLAEGLRSLDIADRARAQVAVEGMTIMSKAGLIHTHPLVRVEKEARAAFAKIVGQLHLDIVPSSWMGGEIG
jgi:hypothetical protein